MKIQASALFASTLIAAASGQETRYIEGDEGPLECINDGECSDDDRRLCRQVQSGNRGQARNLFRTWRQLDIVENENQFCNCLGGCTSQSRLLSDSNPHDLDDDVELDFDFFTDVRFRDDPNTRDGKSGKSGGSKSGKSGGSNSSSSSSSKSGKSGKSSSSKSSKSSSSSSKYGKWVWNGGGGWSGNNGWSHGGWGHGGWSSSSSSSSSGKSGKYGPGYGPVGWGGYGGWETSSSHDGGWSHGGGWGGNHGWGPSSSSSSSSSSKSGKSGGRRTQQTRTNLRASENMQI